MTSRTARFALGMLLITAGSAAARAACPPGQAESGGRCCWPGQEFSASQQLCRGVPTSCPAGMETRGESCAPASSCAGGQLITADTAGHCCWPGQAWSNGRQACVGVPQCPGGTQASGETCVAAAPACAPGQMITADTAGRCCWPGQVWAASRGACVGVPQCPPGSFASGESCVGGGAVQVKSGGYYAPVVSDMAPAQAPPAPPGTVPVAFLARNGRYKYSVAAQGQVCTTPCKLNLRPGPADVSATVLLGGMRTFQRPIVVPSSPALVRLKHLNIGAIVMGSILTPVGISMLGAGIWSIGAFKDEYLALKVVLTTLGIGCTAIGIVGLATIGSDRMDVQGQGSLVGGRRRKVPKVRLSGIGISPTKGGGMVGFGLSY